MKESLYFSVSSLSQLSVLFRRASRALLTSCASRPAASSIAASECARLSAGGRSGLRRSITLRETRVRIPVWCRARGRSRSRRRGGSRGRRGTRCGHWTGCWGGFGHVSRIWTITGIGLMITRLRRVTRVRSIAGIRSVHRRWYVRSRSWPPPIPSITRATGVWNRPGPVIGMCRPVTVVAVRPRIAVHNDSPPPPVPPPSAPAPRVIVCQRYSNRDARPERNQSRHDHRCWARIHRHRIVLRHVHNLRIRRLNHNDLLSSLRLLGHLNLRIALESSRRIRVGPQSLNRVHNGCLVFENAAPMAA